MIAARTTVVDWLHLIRAEYLEMPCLQLTRQQVQRLWGLDELTCNALLEALVDALRAKLEDMLSRPEYLIAEPWVGYRLTPSPDRSAEASGHLVVRLGTAEQRLRRHSMQATPEALTVPKPHLRV